MIIAGPNGSGKSSAYEDTDTEEFGRSVWIINPDVLTRRMGVKEAGVVKLDENALPAVIGAVRKIRSA